LTSTATLMSQVLATAMSHPVRVDAFSILLEGDATAKQIADRLDESTKNVSYHLKVLEKLGCVETASIDPAQGGRVVERTYRASDRAYFDAEAWERLDRKGKQTVSISLMRVIAEDVHRALARGTFFEPDDNHISRSPMNVDRQGWDEVTTYLDGMLFGLFELQDRIDERCRETGAKTFPIKVEVMQFSSPNPRAK
jgi:DNA-binding transcriptional ArsR family regulator